MSHYEISSEGVFRVETTRQAVQISDKLTEHFGVNVIKKMENVLIVGGPYGGVGLALTKNGYNLWSIRITKLPMRTFFNMENSVMVPVFDNPEGTPLDLTWDVPPDMHLIYAIMVVENTAFRHHKFEYHYLVAVDPANGQMYRLPLSNLFTDGKLCHGMANEAKGTSWAVVEGALDAFKKSGWNDHLYRDDNAGEKRQYTKELFRFEPNDEGFKQLQPTKDWRKSAFKLSSSLLQESLIWRLHD